MWGERAELLGDKPLSSLPQLPTTTHHCPHSREVSRLSFGGCLGEGAHIVGPLARSSQEPWERKWKHLLEWARGPVKTLLKGLALGCNWLGRGDNGSHC